MNVGILLPLFREHVSEALDAAVAAEEAGLNGVFAYDHLWPIGRPESPAFAPFPILARVLATTSSLVVGPLVARVGLVADEVLLSQFMALHAIGPGRVLAPLGLGDGLSEAENTAYGLVRAPLDERRARLAALLDALKAQAIPTWVGGSGPKTVALARSGGAAVNLWSSSLDLVAHHAREGEVTWAGDLPRDANDMVEFLDALAQAGASWAVGTYSTRAQDLGEVARSRPWFSSR